LHLINEQFLEKEALKSQQKWDQTPFSDPSLCWSD
jgi:hypothetical protein